MALNVHMFPEHPEGGDLEENSVCPGIRGAGPEKGRWARGTVRLVSKNQVHFLGQGRHTRLDTEKGPFYSILPSKVPSSSEILGLANSLLSGVGFLPACCQSPMIGCEVGGWFGGAEPEKRAWVHVVCDMTLKSRRREKDTEKGKSQHRGGCLIKTAAVGKSARSSQEAREGHRCLQELPSDQA